MSIKLKTALKYVMLGFALIPTIILAVVGFFTMSDFGRKTVDSNMLALGTAQSAAIEACLSEYINDVSFIAKSSYKIGEITSTKDITDEQKNAVLATLNASKSKGDDIKEVLVLAEDGSVVVTTGDSQVGSVFFGYDNISSLKNGQNYISSISPKNSQYGDDNIFFIAKQIVENHKEYGYIVEVISTSKLLTILHEQSFGNGGYMMVSDGKAIVLNYNTTDITRTEEISDNGLTSALTSEKKEVNKNVDFNAGGFVGRYGYISGVTDANWRWICVSPAGNAFNEMFMTIVISISVMLVLAVVCVLLGILQTKAIINPITNMVKTMHEICDENRDVRFQIKGSNEFAQMAQGFNTMLDEIGLSEELHRTISNISDNMLFEWDFHKEIMFVSDNFKEKFDIDPRKSALANGKFLDSLMEEEFSDLYKKDISALLKNKNAYNGEYVITCKNGNPVWFSVRAMCVTDRLGELLRVIGVITDIDSEKNLELQLSERASYDFLSQLFNRSTFERELRSELERSANSKVGILFVDIDDFKFINDRFGHSVGDEVIRFVSDTMKKRVEGNGFAGRFGGDEFVLCITERKQIDDVENLALELIDELYNGYKSELANAHLNVKASIGISISPEHGEEGNQLVAAADAAMYFVKKNGKANYHIYTEEDAVAADANLRT